MIKKLPLPFMFGGKKIVSADIQKPINKVIAQTRAKAQDDDSFGAQVILATGSTAKLIDGDGKEIEDRKQVELAFIAGPFRNVEFAILQGLLATGIDDVIEGIYPCPKCKKVQYSNEPDNSDPDHDDADRVRKLKIVIAPDVMEIYHDLEDPVEIIDADSGEVQETISSVRLHQITAEDLIKASRRVGTGNAVTFNAVSFALATMEVNGKKVDKKWQAEWGQFVYERMGIGDIRAIQKQTMSYGVKQTVKRTCNQCGKVWEAEVDTGSFFASGLEV